MATANISSSQMIKLSLVLTQKEAEYLKWMMQNAMEDNEAPECFAVREVIFNSLKDAGV